MFFKKNYHLCDDYAVYNLTSTDTNLQRVQPAAKKAKLKAVCSFFYDSDSDDLDLRGIEVTLKE